ncbi:outer membrane lipoprotein carrier protein LolA [Neolewinella lacunae]|uniref:Outer membrane lipoprotein carrier protein LolA n=1 Tax=Neolewinella lacunae TaxID=1517758 RepID=A0A923PPZ3_9BACT|nr:outer membrane lipoprotein carrier protein LolA [Neolewinella lacunae]MBC6995656.1 outer membrane lipoprotein carrier protein LolA [Neolewinella lacunae]MDN3634277.1 outer membrane lipoprotein carrier protein LolA [Neolewinella lacunae]
MKSSFLLMLLLFLGGTTLLAQNKQYTSTQDSDPEAIAIIKSVRQKYDAFKTMTANFRLDIALPNQPLETQKGNISRQGDLVRFKLGDQEGIINAQGAYIIQHGNKEVMINNLPEPGEDTGLLTPQSLFSFYEGENFILSLQGEEVQNGVKVKIIELKPVDRNNNEFTKIRLLVDAARKEIVSIKAFARDGSAFTFYLDKTQGNVALAANLFTFKKEEFPGYHVEDLRF